MYVKILKSTVGDGQNLKAGQECDLSDRDARFLIAIGKAEPAEEKKARGKKAANVDRNVDDEHLEER